MNPTIKHIQRTIAKEIGDKDGYTQAQAFVALYETCTQITTSSEIYGVRTSAKVFLRSLPYTLTQQLLPLFLFPDQSVFTQHPLNGSVCGFADGTEPFHTDGDGVPPRAF